MEELHPILLYVIRCKDDSQSFTISDGFVVGGKQEESSWQSCNPGAIQARACATIGLLHGLRNRTSAT